MKKIVLSFVLILSVVMLSGCGGDNKDDGSVKVDKDGNKIVTKSLNDGSVEEIIEKGDNTTVTTKQFADGTVGTSKETIMEDGSRVIEYTGPNNAKYKHTIINLGKGVERYVIENIFPDGTSQTFQEDRQRIDDETRKVTQHYTDGTVIDIIIKHKDNTETINKTKKLPDGKIEKIKETYIFNSDGTKKAIIEQDGRVEERKVLANGNFEEFKKKEEAPVFKIEKTQNQKTTEAENVQKTTVSTEVKKEQNLTSNSDISTNTLRKK